MNVLVYSTDPGIPWLGPSGSSAHLRAIAGAFAARGDRVRVAVPCRVDQRGAVDAPPDVEVVTDEPCRGFTPDLVWERHSLHSGRPPNTAPRVLEVNAPLALERYGSFPPAKYIRHEQRAWQHADRVIAVSAWIRRFIESVGVSPTRVRHVANGSSVSGPGDREPARSGYGLSGFVLGFIGSMKPWHGVDRLPALLDALPEATAILVGDGPVNAPVHPRLRALGRVPERALPDLLAAMDVGLAPYGRATPPWFCPLKLLDYRAAGLPFVTGAAGDAEAIAGPGDRVLRTDDPRAWADAIRDAARQPRVPCPRPWSAVIDEALDGL